jgi:hypothetical protein
MNSRWPWIGFGVLMLAGVIAVLSFGVNPRPVPKIKLSSFDSPAVMANALLLRLRLEIKTNPLVVIGIETDNLDHVAVVQQLIANADPETQFNEVITEAEMGLETQFLTAQRAFLKDGYNAVAEYLRVKTTEGKRILIVTPTIYASQHVWGSFAHRLKNQSQLNPMSLALSTFPIAREAEKSMKIPCVVEGVDTEGPGPLGCLIVQKARSSVYNSVGKETGAFIGLTDLIGLNDYLVLFQKK